MTSEIATTEPETKQGPWESDLKIVSHVIVQVPMKLLLVCNNIADRVDDNEFSIVTDIAERSIDRVILSDEYYIPKQSVTPGSIDYLNDEYHHSVVIHRHPDDHNTFSSTDKAYINQNFELSLLYTQKEKFVNGVYNLKIEDAIVPIPVKVKVTDGLSDIDITNIETRRNELFPLQRYERQFEPDAGNLFTAEDIFAELRDLSNRIDMIENFYYR
jgi:hypothetical protein